MHSSYIHSARYLFLMGERVAGQYFDQPVIQSVLLSIKGLRLTSSTRSQFFPPTVFVLLHPSNLKHIAATAMIDNISFTIFYRRYFIHIRF